MEGDFSGEHSQQPQSEESTNKEVDKSVETIPINTWFQLFPSDKRTQRSENADRGPSYERKISLTINPDDVDVLPPSPLAEHGFPLEIAALRYPPYASDFELASDDFPFDDGLGYQFSVADLEPESRKEKLEALYEAIREGKKTIDRAEYEKEPIFGLRVIRHIDDKELLPFLCQMNQFGDPDYQFLPDVRKYLQGIQFIFYDTTMEKMRARVGNVFFLGRGSCQWFQFHSIDTEPLKRSLVNDRPNVDSINSFIQGHDVNLRERHIPNLCGAFLSPDKQGLPFPKTPIS